MPSPELMVCAPGTHRIGPKIRFLFPTPAYAGAAVANGPIDGEIGRERLRHLMTISRLIQTCTGADLRNDCDHALMEERYWSLRGQVPIIYLLAMINLSAMEIAATGSLSLGTNLPTLSAVCAVIRMWQWFGRQRGEVPSHALMVRRMRQTVSFACILCIAVCARCLYLLQTGDPASQMAVMLFGGLTAIASPMA